MQALPIWNDPATEGYLAHVSAEYKTPERMALYTEPGFQPGFPDSYRIVDKGGPGFGFRAPANHVLTGNWRTVLTRSIDAVLAPGPWKRLGQYAKPPATPLCRVRVYGIPMPDNEAYFGIPFDMQLAPPFDKWLANSRSPTTPELRFRVFTQANGWAAITANDDFSSSYLCAVPRDDALAWAAANLDTTWP